VIVEHAGEEQVGYALAVCFRVSGSVGEGCDFGNSGGDGRTEAVFIIAGVARIESVFVFWIEEEEVGEEWGAPTADLG
jgi:hypothetical protein